jgi:hypothetical protein
VRHAIKRFIVLLLAAILLSAQTLVYVETEGVIVKVDRVEKQLVVRTDRGDETLFLDDKTKGLENAKPGRKVTIKFTEKSGQPKITEIIPK